MAVCECAGTGIGAVECVQHDAGLTLVAAALLCPRPPQILHSYQITHNIKAPFKVAGACDGQATRSGDATAVAAKEVSARCVSRATKHAVLICLTL